MIDFPSYMSAAGFAAPLAGNYFTVEVGTATVSFSSTTAVNPATLSVASATATGTATGTAATATNTGGSKNSAMSKGVDGAAALFVAIGMGLMFA